MITLSEDSDATTESDVPKDGAIAKKPKLDDAHSDEDAALPPYLQRRRRAWQRHSHRADMDIVATGNQIGSPKAKPSFPNVKPCAPRLDKRLPSKGTIPAAIAQWLRDYQVEGTAFLHKLFVQQTGGILGDDMGLGKTVQVIAFLTVIFGKSGTDQDAFRMRTMRRNQVPWYPRVMIVCPGTLIENWKAELDRWGWWHVEVFHGSGKADVLGAAAQGRLEIMITTYSTYRLNLHAINMVDWDCVVADECHQLKSSKSEITKAMDAVNALCRIGLTGTAIQNSYDELWTLLNWTNPGVLGSMNLWSHSITNPLKYGQSHDATVAQLSLARTTAQALVQNLLPRFFLRRLKSLIASQLPRKSDRVVFCPLTATQADAYMNLIEGEVIQTIRAASRKCDCGSKSKGGECCHSSIPSTGEYYKSQILSAITRLQKLSNHLASLVPQSTDPPEKQEKDLEGLQVAVPGLWRRLFETQDSILNYANPEFCGKWKIMKKLLQFWHKHGDKVLVFSHSVRLLRMLQLLFQHTSYNVSFLDGSMKYEDRAKTVAEFNRSSDQFVFLISTKAGGVGLNITSANKVVVVDPHWNPSYDLQAQDRAYRIGQIRDVEVFRLISAGTIEEIVYARQIYKQQQANIGYTASEERRYFKGVHEAMEQHGELFGLENLFTFQEERLVLRDIVHNTNVAESKAGVMIAEMTVEEPNEAVTRSEHRTVEVASADPIQAILAGAGVEYSHENSQVIGTSNVEARLSRNAQQAADSSKHRQAFAGHTADRQWKYRPPLEVRQRQLARMAEMHGYADVVQFALVVESWTQAQRRACLDEYYASRRVGRNEEIWQL